MEQLHAFLVAHIGVILTGILGFAARHFWPQIWNYVSGKGTEDLTLKSLEVLKKYMAVHGATPDEIKTVEHGVGIVLLRIATTIENDEGPGGKA